MEPTFYETYYHHENRHWWFRWRYELITGLVRSLNPSSNWRILDAGCGTGQMLRHLCQFGRVVGVDSSPEAIHFAASRDVDRLVLGSIFDLPFAPESFDCVLSLDVIEHVDEDRQLVQHLYSVVKPGGYLIVTVPAFQSLWSQHDEVNWHKRRYRANQLEALLTETGLEIDRITYCNTALFLPILAARKLKNLKNRIWPSRGADEIPGSDLNELPMPLNEGLFRLMQAERRFMTRRNLPFGVSLLAIGRKPLTVHAPGPAPTPGSDGEEYQVAAD
jgi:SAM-dependent methyltransferase